ncbi:IucA/IucC family protein [Phyllobacterium sp. YR531]|uniref:IucA/IucC family protein n=1 Tax=Phyllobacterium sp. YR531 TaxID=1144343 RepID=UPI000691FFB6|nr:IucA/IucC family protein [Phyllobacterium sp. YR531]
MMTNELESQLTVASQDKGTTPAVVAAGRRVVSQTLGAFLTERLLREGAVFAHPSAGRWGEVSIQAADRSVIYHACVKRTVAYDRWLVDEGSVWRLHGLDSSRCDDPLCLLDDLLPLIVGDSITHDRFREEIRQTFLNHTEALADGGARGCSLANLGYDAAEAFLTDGHRYHPSFKSRIGFTPKDNKNYGPEFASVIKPIWLAVHRDLARSSSIEVPNEQDRSLLLRAETPPLKNDYHILPVHPWQWEREVESAVQREREAGRIILLRESSHCYLAQQSIRTLADQTSSGAPSLKLSLSIRNTSTARTLAPHTVLNAPIVSAWLHNIAVKDSYLSESGTIFLLERMGTTVALPSEHDPDGRFQGSMGAIWRDPLHRYLWPADEQASPFSMLTHLDAGGYPSIRNWLDTFGVESWTRALLTVSAIPVVHLLTAYGIALESHQQNMVLIHRNGWPLRVALKDFHDGVRFVPKLLRTPAPRLVATPADHARVNPNSYVEARDPEDVRDFMFDALFGVNLAELAFFLEKHFAFDERAFWSLVAEIIETHHKSYDIGRKGVAEFGLLSPDVVVEDLARRRLENGPVPGRRAPNPLVHASASRGQQP